MLIKQGHTVVGVDNMNDAYDPRIKEYRLKKLQALQDFEFVRDDISDREILNRKSPIVKQEFDGVIKLAARAGVLRATKMLSRSARGLPEPAAGGFAAQGFSRQTRRYGKTLFKGHVGRFGHITNLSARRPSAGRWPRIRRVPAG